MSTNSRFTFFTFLLTALVIVGSVAAAPKAEAVSYKVSAFVYGAGDGRIFLRNNSSFDCSREFMEEQTERCRTSMASNQTRTFVAKPFRSSVLWDWTGGCTSVDLKDRECVVSNPMRNKGISAVFKRVPKTKITSRRIRRSSATFYFSSDIDDATFTCSLDGRAFRGCESPASYSDLSKSRHSFEVRARYSGITGRSARARWGSRRGSKRSSSDTRARTISPAGALSALLSRSPFGI